LAASTYTKVACAKLYDRKTPITAADLLNDRGGAVVRGARCQASARLDQPRQRVLWKPRLTAGIAHETKNPLNFVNNFSGLSAELIDELRVVLKGVSFDEKVRVEIEELADT
jgi:signal transduction histidine kinase